MTTSARDSDLGQHEIGYEWEAGDTPLGDSSPGKWAVRRNENSWEVLFHSAIGAEYSIHTFPLTEGGERAAKTLAAKIVDIAFGRA